MYHVIRCDLGVRINPKYPIATHKVFYIVDRNEIRIVVEEYLRNVPQLKSKTGFDYVKEQLIKDKAAFTLKEAVNRMVKLNKLNKSLCQQ